jgi:hypothetical protein
MRRRRHHHPDPNRNDAYERYSAWRALEPATTIAPSAAPVVQQRTRLSSCEQSRRVDDSSCVRRSVAGGVVLLTSTNGWLVVDSGPWEVPLDRSVWLACRCSYSATTAAASSVTETLAGVGRGPSGNGSFGRLGEARDRQAHRPVIPLGLPDHAILTLTAAANSTPSAVPFEGAGGDQLHPSDFFLSALKTHPAGASRT